MEPKALLYEELMWRSVYPGYDPRSGTGVVVTERTATTIPDVFKCVHVISEDIAKQPKKVMRQTKDSAGRDVRVEAPTHPLFWLLKAEANPSMSSFRFFETGIIHLLTWGNWYNYIQRGAQSGRVQALWPLCPDYVRIERRSQVDPNYDPGVLGDSPYWYMILNPETNQEERFFPDEILHIPFFSYDGICGRSPVRLLMDSMGLAKATERYAGRFFGNAARPAGILSPGEGVKLTIEQRNELRESLKLFSGENTGRIAIIDGTTKWQQLTMPNDEAQFLETRQFSRIDIAGIYRVPPHKIADLENAHLTNIEASEIAYVKDALQPTAERIEQEFERQLLSRDDKGRVYIHIDLEGQLRGDVKSRAEYYKARFNMASMSPNEIRVKEDEAPFDGGDEKWIQLNMVPLSIAKELLIKESNQGGGGTSLPDRRAELKQYVSDELVARARPAYTRIFRDVINRITRRKKEDRRRYAPTAFEEVYSSLADLLGCGSDEDFRREYLANLAKRSVDWVGASDGLVNDELERCISSLLTHSWSVNEQTRLVHEQV